MKLGDILFKSLLTAIAVFLIHALLIIIFDIYQYINWIDIPIHFLGGVAISLGTIILLNLLITDQRLQPLPLSIKIILAITVTLGIAVVWECYEWLMGYLNFGIYQESLNDTMLDLVMGGSGGILTGLIYLIFYKRK
ncbi:MAG: hypothetical protein PHS07_02380 [Patescibacteria group bacterium]|nr:hypothetical protein [Patescibacteria group bacterium]